MTRDLESSATSPPSAKVTNPVMLAATIAKVAKWQRAPLPGPYNSVAISGDTVVVGANYVDIGGNLNQGSAYVFVRNGATWTQQEKLTAADGTGNDDFGFSVAISHDTVVVGAINDDVGGGFGQGSAYVFVRSGTTWSQQEKLTAGDGVTFDSFGFSVAISGDTVVVGSWFDDIGGEFDQGSAYVFVRSGGTWSQQQKLTATDGDSDDHFGVSVGISGDTVVIGAPNDDLTRRLLGVHAEGTHPIAPRSATHLEGDPRS